MPSFLTFTLAAPLAAFGGVAVGERRASADRPAKSAVLGLVAGALGIERDANDAHLTLAQDFFFAVRVEDMNVRSRRRLMTDYHTVQAPPRGRKQHFSTRREETLYKKGLGTILSYREYRGDCIFTLVLWPRVASPRFELDELRTALRKPVFVPYAGRKSCPLMLPMQPRIFDAASLHDALIQYDAMQAAKRGFLEKYGLSSMPITLALDAEAEDTRGSRRERQRDNVVDRQRWQFGLREEVIVPWGGNIA